MWEIETDIFSTGRKAIVGLDEVGRGALAGPVYVGAVCWRQCDETVVGVGDSKTIRPHKRAMIAEELVKTHSWAVGRAEHTEIDQHGISMAIMFAAQRAISQLSGYDFVLIDGRFSHSALDWLNTDYQCVIRGDASCYSIGAASIVAKESRDSYMRGLAQSSKYGWGTNVGYGTKSHTEAISALGLSSQHRRSFCRRWIRIRDSAES